MKITRDKITRTINRLHRLVDSLRLYIGLGKADQADLEDLDNMLDKIDRLERELDRMDRDSQAWRERHKAGIIAHRKRTRQAAVLVG